MHLTSFKLKKVWYTLLDSLISSLSLIHIATSVGYNERRKLQLFKLQIILSYLWESQLNFLQKITRPSKLYSHLWTKWAWLVTSPSYCLIPQANHMALRKWIHTYRPV